MKILSDLSVRKFVENKLFGEAPKKVLSVKDREFVYNAVAAIANISLVFAAISAVFFIGRPTGRLFGCITAAVHYSARYDLTHYWFGKGKVAEYAQSWFGYGIEVMGNWKQFDAFCDIPVFANFLPTHKPPAQNNAR